MFTIHSIIKRLQAYNPNDTIEDLLHNPGFVREITESVKLLSKTSKAIVSKIILNHRLPPKQDKRSIKALKAIQKIKNIDLPSKVLLEYRECQQCPSRFWSWAGIQLDLNADETKPIEIFFCEAYLGISQLETQREWDTIKWRFFLLFFYDLIVSFRRNYLTASFEDEFVGILSSSQSILDTALDIRENLRRWISAGSRYSLLSDSLGKGAPFLLPQSVTDKTWENGLPLDGPIYTSAVEHLKSKSFCEKSKELGADALGAEIREAILKPFQWHLSTLEQNTHSNISKLYQGPTDTRESIGPRESELTGQPDEVFSNNEEGGIEAESITFGSNRSSINALLNPAEPIQSQQLSSVGSSSFAIGSGAGLSGCEQDATAGEHAEFESSRKGNRGLELQSQSEADSPPNKRRRVDTFQSHDSSLSQPSNHTPGDANISPVYQTEGARQPIDTIEEHNTGRIQVRKEQREIESIYSDALIEKLDSNLEEPFHNPIMARYQKGLENCRQSLMLMVPRAQKQDCTFSITIDRTTGYEIIKLLGLQDESQDESSRRRLKQYSNMPKEKLSLLGNYLHQGIIRTGKFKSELGPYCTCVYAFTYEGDTDDTDDITFSMMFDRHWGFGLRDMLDMRKMEIDL